MWLKLNRVNTSGNPYALARVYFGPGGVTEYYQHTYNHSGYATVTRISSNGYSFEVKETPDQIDEMLNQVN